MRRPKLPIIEREDLKLALSLLGYSYGDLSKMTGMSKQIVYEYAAGRMGRTRTGRDRLLRLCWAVRQLAERDGWPAEQFSPAMLCPADFKPGAELPTPETLPWPEEPDE